MTYVKAYVSEPTRQGDAMVEKYLIVLYGVHWGLGNNSNLMVFCEGGQMPPSVLPQINVICYLSRLCRLPSRMIVKQIYTEMCRLHKCGFVTWVQKPMKLYNTAVLNWKINVQLSLSNIVNKLWRTNSWITGRPKSKIHLKNPIIRYYKVTRLSSA